MGLKTYQSFSNSPKVEVGEIDTRAPFESVRAAVTLFGEGAHVADKTLIKKPKAMIATEKLLARETQLHMAQKELNKFKDQVSNAETTKAQALNELEKAKRTVADLIHKLKMVNESKESAIKATETAKNQAQQLEEANSVVNGGAWKEAVESSRQQYVSAVRELDASKQELWKMRQEFEGVTTVKDAAYQRAVSAEKASLGNKGKAEVLSTEVTAVQESLLHVKLASSQSLQEREKILAEKDVERQAKVNALNEMEQKMEMLKKDFDPELVKDLEEKLAATGAEIAALQKEMADAKISDEESLQAVTAELDDAKVELQKLADEESSLRTSVESLRQELDLVKKEHNELKAKEAEAENTAGNLHIKLQKSKAELEAALAGENKARAAVDELTSTLWQLSQESKDARSETLTMKIEAEESKKEAELTLIALEEAEKKLQIALKEAEEAKAAEAVALDQIKILSEKTNAARASTSESGAQLTLSVEEYEALKVKVEESNKLCEMKVAAAVAQVEAIKASEHQAVVRMEAAKKEIEEMVQSTREALKRADMAEVAKRAVEGELRRWREREQKRAAEAAARILTERDVSNEPSPRKWTPSERQLQKVVTGKLALEKVAASSPPKPRVLKSNSSLKVERKSSSLVKKALLSNLSGIFQKKSKVEGGSPSYLPREKSM